jgi:hypothetical protein
MRREAMQRSARFTRLESLSVVFPWSAMENADRGMPKGKRGTGAWRHCDTIRGPDDSHLYLAIKRPRDYSHASPLASCCYPGSPLLSGRIVHSGSHRPRETTISSRGRSADAMRTRCGRDADSR